MGLFSSLVHSGIQRGYFPLFIFLICLFLVLLLFSFSFFKLGSFPQDQFGANIWSETVHGEGRLGDFGRGGGGLRQRQKQKIPVWVYMGCLAERRGRSAPKELGTGATALGSKNQPSRELGEQGALLCTVAVPLCSTALLQEDGDVPRDPKALLFLLWKGGYFIRKGDWRCCLQPLRCRVSVRSIPRSLSASASSPIWGLSPFSRLCG